MSRRPIVADQGLAIAGGLLAVAVGMGLLYDAWNGRGKPPPVLLRPLIWF